MSRSSGLHSTVRWGKDPSTVLCRASPVCTEMDQLLCLLLQHLYLPRQDLITPGKPGERGLRQRAPCSHCMWAEHSGYLPSCPVEAQYDMSMASLSYGSQPCLSTCTPLDPLVSAVPSEVPGASADTGQPRRRLAPECPREYGGLSSCLSSLQRGWTCRDGLDSGRESNSQREGHSTLLWL